MFNYRITRPKPPQNSGQYETLRWQEGEPLPLHWILSECEGPDRVRQFFILKQDTLLLPLSDNAAIKLAAHIHVEGCQMRDAYRDRDRYLFDLEDWRGEEFEFTLPIVKVMTREEVLDTAFQRGPDTQLVWKDPNRPANEFARLDRLRPLVTTKPTPVALQVPAAVDPQAPVVLEAVMAAPAPVVDQSAPLPEMAETLSWSKERLFVEYWTLRAGT
jgi:hypothetical protein